MDNLGAAHRYNQLPPGEQRRVVTASRQMTKLARDHAVPIIFAPPLIIGGKMNSATGCVLQLGTASYVVTAYHVVAKYKERIDDGEVLNWQVGNLPPFDPTPRIVWSDVDRDIALMRLLPEETTEIGPCLASVPSHWPPVAPKEGELVLVGGYPKVLQEIGPSGDIVGSGPYSALFRVTTTGEGYFNCHIEQRDLISFDGGPLPEPGTEMGGLSGGPVLLVGMLSYPLAGIITDMCSMTLAELNILRVSTMDGVTV